MQEGEGQSEQNDKAADDDAMDVDQQAEPQVGSFGCTTEVLFSTLITGGREGGRRRKCMESWA